MKNNKLIIIVLVVLVVIVAAVFILGSLRKNENGSEETGEPTETVTSSSSTNQIHTAEGAGMNASEYSSFIEDVKNPTSSGNESGASTERKLTTHAGTSIDPVRVGEWISAYVPVKDDAKAESDYLQTLVRVTAFDASYSGTTVDYEIVIPDGYPLAKGNSFYSRCVFYNGSDKGNNASDVIPNCRVGYVVTGKWQSSDHHATVTLENPNNTGIVFRNG